MTNINNMLPDKAIAYDVVEKKLFLKECKFFLFSFFRVVKADKIREWKEWQIKTNHLPNKLYINGRLYNLKLEDSELSKLLKDKKAPRINFLDQNTMTEYVWDLKEINNV